MNRTASDTSGLSWRRAPDVAYVDDGHRLVVLALSVGAVSRPQLILGSGAVIWRALGARRTEEDLATILRAEDPGLSIAGRDVSEIMQALQQAGLCEVTEE